LERARSSADAATDRSGARQRPASHDQTRPDGDHIIAGRPTTLLASRDLAIGLVIAVVAGAVSWAIAWRQSSPLEDAAMLFRFADNIAAGHGIAWNPGEHPVDGATDLGFLFAVAGLRVLGMSAQTGAFVLDTIAFAATACLLYVFSRARRLATPWALTLVALFVLGPGLAISAAGFSAVAFAATLAGVFVLVLRMTDTSSLRHAVLVGCVGIVPGIVRPEGYLYVGILLAAALVIGVPWRRLAASAGIIVGSGLVFLAWRWHTFGYPLPNPYYKKGSGSLHSDGFASAAHFLWDVALIPVVVLVVVGPFLRPVDRRRWAAYLLAIVAMLTMWSLLSSEMNFLYRFQYPLFVVSLFMVADLLTRTRVGWVSDARRLPDARGVLCASIIVLLAASMFATRFRPVTAPEPQQAVAGILSSSGQTGLTVATTEAGYVCWQSGWRCVDLWGLTNARVAHDGFLDQAQLAALHPAVIFVHAFTSPRHRTLTTGYASSGLPGWSAMTTPVIRFAEHDGYRLVAALRASPDAGYFVYVRPGLPATAALTHAFARLRPSLQTSYGPPATDGRYHLPVEFG